MRKWLADRGILRKAGDQPEVPVSDEDVATFEQDHTGGPVSGQPIKMHWKSGLSSKWNRQALFVLASTFLAEHQDCGFKVEEIQAIFCRKLERTRQEWVRRQALELSDLLNFQAEAAKKYRRKSRLQGVSQYIYMSSSC
jgi:hypothetical protein